MVLHLGRVGQMHMASDYRSAGMHPRARRGCAYSLVRRTGFGRSVGEWALELPSDPWVER
jgi:hypothetical protein